MPFHTDLHVVLLNEKTRQGQDLYMLTDTLVYHNEDKSYTIIVPAGFTSDFATVPRIPFVYATFGNTATKEAVVHDYLLEVATNIRQRFYAHRVFLEALLESKSRQRSYAMFAGVVAYDLADTLVKRIRN